MIVVDDDACRLYEVLGDEDETDPLRSVFAAVDWDLRATPHRPSGYTSADQAGLPIFPGLARFSEVADGGEIDHALRFSSVDVADAFMAPATHAAGQSPRLDVPPFGARFRLRADVPCTGMGPEVTAMCVALKRYGMFLADRASVFALSGTVDDRWPDGDAMTEQLGRLRAADFDVVDTGAAVVPRS